MKKSFSLFLCVAVILFTSCSPSNNSEKQTLTGHTWELEYLSGPKITFEGLFDVKKPQLTFDQENKTVTGNDGCNNYEAPFTLDGNKLSFGESSGPTTLMYCGDGDVFFQETIKKIDAYKMEGDKLVLLSDDMDMMRFHKTDQ